MKQCMAGIAFALVALLVFAPVASAQSKWVRGTIVSVAGDTLVVKVAGNDMTFKVDKSTQLTARGAGKAQTAAEAKGEARRQVRGLREGRPGRRGPLQGRGRRADGDRGPFRTGPG